MKILKLYYDGFKPDSEERSKIPDKPGWYISAYHEEVFRIGEEVLVNGKVKKIKQLMVPFGFEPKYELTQTDVGCKFAVQFENLSI